MRVRGGRSDPRSTRADGQTGTRGAGIRRALRGREGGSGRRVKPLVVTRHGSCSGVASTPGARRVPRPERPEHQEQDRGDAGEDDEECHDAASMSERNRSTSDGWNRRAPLLPGICASGRSCPARACRFTVATEMPRRSATSAVVSSPLSTCTSISMCTTASQRPICPSGGIRAGCPRNHPLHKLVRTRRATQR